MSEDKTLILKRQTVDGKLYGQLADKSTRRQPSRRQFNLPTLPNRRQTNSPKLIYGRFGTLRNAVESMKVALTCWVDRFSLELWNAEAV